jgi:hypothetical protein
LYGPNLRERLIGRPHCLSDAVLHAGARAPQSSPEEERRADDKRDDGERRRRETRVRQREQHDAPDEKEGLS